jgi:hypothetical protein
VFVVAPAADGRAGRARPVPVETGAAWNGSIQIHRGLSAGQLVVVQGNERLPPVEQDVQIQRALPPQERAVVEAPPRGAAP